MTTMKHTKSETDQYLAVYPDLQRWMNVCAACGREGYKPEMPENIYPHFNVGAQNLRAMFRPLDVVDGLCEVCRDLVGA